MESFIFIADDSDFTLHNIPFGVFEKGGEYRACTRVGDTLIDLYQCLLTPVFDNLHIPPYVFCQPFLNDFIRMGKEVTRLVRTRLIDGLQVGGVLDNDIFKETPLFVPIHDAQMVLPIQIGDYTDFYSSREHATNVGIMFRDPANALLPNWLHLPVGYHGRASSIAVSGTPVIRPSGQTMPDGAGEPVFGPSKQLDFELEMAFVVGKDTTVGSAVPTDKAEDYIFGLMLFNDWSARDIQKWEYVPLGPFLAKNFASTVSPWIITLEALEPFRVSGPIQDPPVLPYLACDGAKNYDINLSVDIYTPNGQVKRASTSNFKFMYWNMCQQLAHHTINGCNIRVGDLMASGTISGPTPNSYGSMLEICWKGTKPLEMPDGSLRRFIEDGDTVSMRGWCDNGEVKLGFGVCEAKVYPTLF